MVALEEGVAAVKASRVVAEAETEGKLTDPLLPDSFSTMRNGVFVTVNEHPSGLLRGCIGYPVPPFSLDRALVTSARGVCHDPRFPPLRLNQAKSCVFEVSILTCPEDIGYGSASELKSKIEIGKDGLIVRYQRNKGLCQSALYLPQVPVEQEWDIDQYLSSLCMKAGLQDDAWMSGVLEFQKFQAEVFKEVSPGGEIVRG